MSNNYFRFKQFTVYQEHTPMKVGTDGTLLGAWASGGQHILDVGTGTGLIALMMAQRFVEADVTAIDIDPQACKQAAENVKASPFAERITVHNLSLQDFAAATAQRLPYSFDAIVCNPPFFSDSLVSPDFGRTIARHARALTYDELCHHAWNLLADNGEFSTIVPVECCERMETAAVLAGFHVHRKTSIRTTPSKPPRRILLAFGRHSQNLEAAEITINSNDYRRLTADFYLEKHEKM